MVRSLCPTHCGRPRLAVLVSAAATSKCCLSLPVMVINLLPVSSKLTLPGFSVNVGLGHLNIFPFLVGTKVLLVEGAGDIEGRNTFAFWFRCVH